MQIDSKRLIKAIKTGQRSLGMTEDEYRAFLIGICGKQSCTDMTPKELQQVLFGMRKMGFRSITPPQVSKIRTVWDEMHQIGIVRVNTDAAIDAYARRICKYPLQECSAKQLETVIETLKQWISRDAREAAARLNAILEGTKPAEGVIQGRTVVQGSDCTQ